MTSTTSCCLLVGSVALATLAGAHDLAAEILVGFAGPLTGEMELAGEQMQNGTDLAVAELNAAGGVLGQKVVLDQVDDHCDGEQAVAAARKLVADGATVAIGHLCSNAAIPASEVYEAARIPFITVASNPLVTGRGLHWTFGGSPPDGANARFTAAYMVRQFAAKRIAIVHDTRAYGKGLAELTRKSLEELGLQVILFEAVQPGQLLFTDLIERLRRADADVLYCVGYPSEIGLLRRQMAEAAALAQSRSAWSSSASNRSGIVSAARATGREGKPYGRAGARASVMCTTRERSAAWWRSYGYLAPPFDGCARPVRNYTSTGRFFFSRGRSSSTASAAASSI